MRVIPVSRSRPPRSPYAVHVVVLLAVYLVLLAWVVVWKLEVPHLGEAGRRPLKLVPFVSTGEYGSSAPREVLANLLLFVPLGVYAGLLVRRGAWPRVALAGVATSAFLEAAQYALAVGSADLTDVIVNTTGTFVGFALLAALRRVRGTRSMPTIARWGLVGTLVAGVVCTTFAVSPLHWGRRDVIVRPAVSPTGSAAHPDSAAATGP